MAAFTNYAENKIIDWLLRGQVVTLPASWYVGLHSVAGTDATMGTELSGGGYARIGVTANLTNWSGTQAALSTIVSSGTGGLSSNNAAIAFGTPSGAWGEAVDFGLWDAISGGNCWVYGALEVAKLIYEDDIVVIPVSTLTFQIDN